MRSTNRRNFTALTATVLLAPALARAQQVTKPAPELAGLWRLIGQTHARYGADHSVIIVQAPSDNFHRIKFKVSNSPLNLQRMVATYDNGAFDRIDVRQNIPRGGESRAIDLRGAGKRSLRKVEIWYDAKEILGGQAEVSVFAMK
jgi:hypothetical protein